MMGYLFAFILLILLCGVIILATWQFHYQYKKHVVSSIETTPVNTCLLTENDIATLPEPVKKYIRYTGCLNKPKVESFKIVFDGKIRKNEASAWMPFNSEQYNFVAAGTRLFFMKATMKGLPVTGFHCYANGKAFMDIRLLSLFKVQFASGEQMDAAETVTFFNDMCCMAPATLIDNRIQWQTLDNKTVSAIFTNQGIAISATLYFNDEGALINFISDDRYAAGEKGQMKKVRWSTPIKKYSSFNGHNLFSEAETIYAYPEGDLCYGIFKTRSVEYNCGR